MKTDTSETARSDASLQKPGLLRRLAGAWRAELLSAKDLVRRAGVITVVFLTVQFAGLREFTSILCGTMDSMELGWRTSAFLGLLYVFLYLAFVLLVPALLLAALLLSLWRRWLRPGQHLKSA